MKPRLTVLTIILLIALLLTPTLASAGATVEVEPPTQTSLGVIGPTITIDVDAGGIIPCVRISIGGLQVMRDPKTQTVTVVPPEVSVEVVRER